MTIHFSGDEFTLWQRDPHTIIQESITLDAADPTKGTSVPLELWVNAYSAVPWGEVSWDYGRITPCPPEEQRHAIEHNCQDCSVYNKCPTGTYAVCDGTENVECRV